MPGRRGRRQRPGLVCELAGGGRRVFVRISSFQFWVKMQDSQEKGVNGGLPILSFIYLVLAKIQACAEQFGS